MHRIEVSSPQATALIAALDSLTEEQLQSLLPSTRQELNAAYHRLRSELARQLYCK